MENKILNLLKKIIKEDEDTFIDITDMDDDSAAKKIMSKKDIFKKYSFKSSPVFSLLLSDSTVNGKPDLPKVDILGAAQKLGRPSGLGNSKAALTYKMVDGVLIVQSSEQVGGFVSCCQESFLCTDHLSCILAIVMSSLA